MSDRVRLSRTLFSGISRGWLLLGPSNRLKMLLIFFLCAIIGSLEFLFFLLVSPFVRVRLGRISSERIGHFILEYDWYFSFLKKQDIPKLRPQIDIFFYKGKICNTYLDQLWRQKVRILPRALVFPLFAVIRVFPSLSHFLVPLPLRPTDFSVIDNLPSSIKLTDLEIDKGVETLKSVGIHENSKLVCLYVRDSAYAESLGLQVDFTSYRDTSIENYIPLIQELTNRGFFVLRMGKVTDKELIVRSPKFLDYANSKIRSDFLDFYISSVCEFAICTDSGMMQFPIAFRKPLGLVNVPAFHGILKGDCLTLFQFMTFLDSTTELELNLKELMNRGFEDIDHLQGFLDIQISHAENSSTELLNFALELLEVIESPNENEAKYLDISEAFRSVTKLNDEDAKVPRLSLSWEMNHPYFLSNS